MNIQKGGSNVILTRDEFDAIAGHMKQFEIIVKGFEKRWSAGELEGSWEKPWAKLKRFLQSQELPGSQDSERPDGRYCCILRTKYPGQGRIANCRDYNAWYIFAWVACVAEAIVGGFDATLVSGRCRRQHGCPQAG